MWSVYLAHHGILGQKWGKKNGPPYPLNPEDHSKSEQNAGWRKSLDGNSKADGSGTNGSKKQTITEKMAKNFSEDYEKHYGGAYTKEAAAKAGMDKEKILKRVAIGAGVVVGISVAAYVYKEYGRNFADGIISEGTTIQTLSVDPDRMQKGQAFYTAFTEADKDSYMSFFGKDRYTGENKEIIQALVNKDIRIAGTNTGKKVFDKLMDTDDDFYSTVMSAIAGDWSELPFVKTDYEKYNVMLVRNEYDDAHKKFYDALKELGYGAVADVNDRYNPYIKSHAAIVFDRSGIMRTNLSHVEDWMIDEAEIKKAVRDMIDEFTSPLSVALGGVGAVGLAGSYADSRNRKRYANKNPNERG